MEQYFPVRRTNQSQVIRFQVSRENTELLPLFKAHLHDIHFGHGTARGPIVLGTARLIYTTKYVRVFSMLISGTALLKEERHS